MPRFEPVDHDPFAAPRVALMPVDDDPFMTSPEAAQDAGNPITPEEAIDIYRRLAGEVEARNATTRLPMTAAERRATPPWETQDVPDDQQIVRFR